MKKRIKRLASRASAALVTLALSLGMLSMPVYAGGGGEEDTGAEWTEDVPVTVVPEPEPVMEEPEPEPLPPLTPDGNMTLVDDIEEVTEHNKQFITVVTKNGNYFYIIIDRDDEGEDTVHFLNQVDEADLLSLIEEEEAAGYRPAEPEVVVEEEPEIEEEPVEAEPPKKGKGATILLLILLLFAGGGGAYFYFFVWKRRRTARSLSLIRMPPITRKTMMVSISQWRKTLRMRNIWTRTMKMMTLRIRSRNWK